MQNGIVIMLLLLLLLSGTTALILDARQRRLDRRVAKIMPETDVTIMLSLRRLKQSSKWRIVRYVFNYDLSIRYDVLSPIYVFILGIAIVPAICFVINYLDLPFVCGLAGGGTAAVLAVRYLFGWQQYRHKDRIFRQLPDVVELVTSTVRAGLPVVAAFRVIARETSEPTKSQFGIVCSEISSGLSPEAAMENVGRRTRVAEYGMFAVTLAVQSRAGGSMADTLQTLGNTVRQRVGLAGRARALAGEVIFSARALSVSPFVIGGLLYLMNHESVDLLFTDPTGRLLLAYAGTSVLCGTVVIRWMVRKGTSL